MILWTSKLSSFIRLTSEAFQNAFSRTSQAFLRVWLSFRVLNFDLDRLTSYGDLLILGLMSKTITVRALTARYYSIRTCKPASGRSSLLPSTSGEERAEFSYMADDNFCDLLEQCKTRLLWSLLTSFHVNETSLRCDVKHAKLLYAGKVPFSRRSEPSPVVQSHV